MDNPIIFQILGVLLVLFFGFVTYMNTKTWKWVHVTFLLLVFFMVPTFAVYAAMTLKTRAKWMDWVQKHEDEVKKYEQSVALLRRGEANDVKAEKDSIFAKSEALSRMILDRGRVWRGCTPAGVQGGAVTLQVPFVQVAAQPQPQPAPMPMPVDPMAQPVDPMAQPVDPMAQPMPMPMPMPQPAPAPAAPASGHNITQKLVVYAFKEMDSPDGFKVPQFYLGEFWVTDTTDTTVSLAPTMPLTPEQAQEVNAGNSTWMLYETCPIDSHEIFEGLDAAAISQLIPQADTGLPPAEYAALIDSYVQDGKRAPDNTPPDNLWAEVKFLKTHKEDVDAAAANEAPDVSPFDSSGLALPARLRRAESDLTEFEPGDFAVLPAERADELQAQGIVEKIQPIYRRQLVEYSARLRTIYRRKLELDWLLKEVDKDIKTLAAANTKAEEQITLLTELNRQLKEDIAKVTFERDGIAAYQQDLQGKLDQTNGEIRALYASTHALNLELRQLTAKATEEADRRTREATAASGR